MLTLCSLHVVTAVKQSAETGDSVTLLCVSTLVTVALQQTASLQSEEHHVEPLENTHTHTYELNGVVGGPNSGRF